MYFSEDAIIFRNYFSNMGGMSFPSQIIVNKDSQELGCINLFNIFVINFCFEIWHRFIIVFIFKDHKISFINI